MSKVDLRVPTSQYANRKLKTRADEPKGATQSGRRYRSANGEPTIPNELQPDNG
jgi:hypothetical protein